MKSCVRDSKVMSYLIAFPSEKNGTYDTIRQNTRQNKNFECLLSHSESVLITKTNTAQIIEIC